MLLLQLAELHQKSVAPALTFFVGWGLTVWEDADFNYGDNNIPRKKHRISIIASYNNPRITRANLKNIKKLNDLGSWNDCISAISCHFGYFDRTLLDY